jgi:hypothetical protein
MRPPDAPARAVTPGALLVCLLLVSCAGPVPPPPVSPGPFADSIPLPGSFPWPSPPATPPACAGVGLDAILHGDPADPAVTWLDDRAGGGRLEVTWPVGFRARFAPRLVVVDPTGRVVHRDGDAIDGACVDGDRMLLGYP